MSSVASQSAAQQESLSSDALEAWAAKHLQPLLQRLGARQSSGNIDHGNEDLSIESRREERSERVAVRTGAGTSPMLDEAMASNGFANKILTVPQSGSAGGVMGLELDEIRSVERVVGRLQAGTETCSSDIRSLREEVNELQRTMHSSSDALGITEGSSLPQSFKRDIQTTFRNELSEMLTRQQEQVNEVRLSEIEFAMRSCLQPLAQQINRIEQQMNCTAMSQMNWTNTQKEQSDTVTKQSGASLQLMTRSNEEPKMAESLKDARRYEAASDQVRIADGMSNRPNIPDSMASLPEKVAQRVSDVLLEKLPEKIHAIIPEQKTVLPLPPGIDNHGLPYKIEAPPQITPVLPVTPAPAKLPPGTPGEGHPFNLFSDDFHHDDKEEPVDDDKEEYLDVDLKLKMQAKVKYGKLSMSEDHHIDDTGVKLNDDESLAAVFTTDTDPEKPPYNVEAYYKQHGVCQAIARSPRFANLTVLIVFLNAVYLGVDSDYNHATNLYDSKLPFLLTSQFFCVYFTGELLIRFLAFQKMPDCFKDGWFKFDLFLVASMILDSWIIMPALYIMAGDSNFTIPTQPLRMLRLFKLTRMARLMKAFPELVTMIKALVRALRAIASSFLLIIVMVYTWAILIHMLLRDEDNYNRSILEQYDYEFSKIPDCMWTLFMAGTLMLDNVSPLLRSLVFGKSVPLFLAGLALISYCFLSALLILQMLIGVLCEVVSNVTQERKDAECIGLLKQELLADLKRHDDGDGKLSKKEFETEMETVHTKALLKKLNINRLFLIEVAGLMFPDPQAQVPIRTVLELMLMCKGDNVVTVQIIASALCYLTNELNSMQETMALHMSVLKPKRKSPTAPM